MCSPKAADPLAFNPEAFAVESCELDGRKVSYRSYKDISYCERPLDPIQKLHIYVPLAYYSSEKVGAYTLRSAPIFLPNTVGGYMPGPAIEPGIDSHTGQPNSLFEALLHGYVVVSAGVRGRTSGKISHEFFEGSVEGKLGEEGRKVGRAPAFIVDYKAAIRYLRHNKEVIPGNVERIVTNGTSAGGALSSLAGATGNAPEYEPYLNAIGAAKERDDIFAASCYCPIHNLENADMAYEWQFSKETTFHRTRHHRDENGKVTRVPFSGDLTEEQVGVAKDLACLFPEYVNSLHLTNQEGKLLSLESDGNGSFRDHVTSHLEKSILKEASTLDNETNRKWLMTPGSEIAGQDYFTLIDGKVTDFDWTKFVAKTTRMKAPPAFDALDLSSPENEEFGDEEVDGRHFTAYAYEHSHAKGAEKAKEEILYLMNPIPHIQKGTDTTAKYWRIRHGSFDRDTSLAIPTILATLLENKGYVVDFALPWGLPHSGDYDLPELFAWIDQVVELAEKES